MSTRKFKPFTGHFAPMLQMFLEQKQALGFDYVGGYNILQVFDKFSKNYNIQNYEMSKELVLDWGKKRPNENENYRRARIYQIQNFTSFLIEQGYKGYISPPQRFTNLKYPAYIFTIDEIRRIFEVLDNMEYSCYSPYKHLTLPLLYKMLYGCGFRISELLNISFNDVDLEKGIVHITNAKNGIERLVPMSNSLTAKCREYADKVKDKIYPELPFFFKKDNSGYSVSNIEKHFRELLWEAEIPYQGKERGPRIHDLRHTYICHRLNLWVKNGEDLLTLLPVLSKYVGHSSISSTQYYLKLTAEVYPDIIEKVENYTNEIFPEFGGEVYE